MTNKDYLITFLDTIGFRYTATEDVVDVAVNDTSITVLLLSGKGAVYSVNNTAYNLIQLCMILFDKLRVKESNKKMLHNILNTVGMVYGFKYISRVNMINSVKGFRIYVNKDYSFVDMDTDIEYETLTELVDIFIIGR